MLPTDFRDRYLRGGIAERIIEAYPRATWSGGARLVEDPDPTTDTDFESASAALFERLRLWTSLLRADILAGLGHYSVLLVGAKGDLSQPMPTSLTAADILYLTPRGEDKAKIREWEQDRAQPRFGQPLYYEIDLGLDVLYPESNRVSGVNNQKVHWSRVLHVAEGVLEDEIFGKPRLRAVWNLLDDLFKIVGGGAEAAWKRADPGIQAALNPEYEFDAASETDMAAQIDEYIHGMRRVLRTKGVDLKLLPVQVANFGNNADSVLRMISATTGIPARILTGSERGELASSQDRRNWNERVMERRREFAEPIIRRLVDQFMGIGVLPDPGDYSIRWPDIEELDEGEKARVAAQMAVANRDQIMANGRVILGRDEIRQTVFGLGPMEGDEAAEREPVTRTRQPMSDVVDGGGTAEPVEGPVGVVAASSLPLIRGAP